MYSCIIFLLTEGTARILSYSHNTEMPIEVRVAGKESNEDPQILPRKVQSKARSWVGRSMQKVQDLKNAEMFARFAQKCSAPLFIVNA